MILLADFSWQSLLPLAAMLIAITVLMRRLRRHRRRQKPSKDYLVRTPRPTKSGTPSHHLDTPDDVLRWEVEMHEIVRDFSAQIDSKASVLGHLIQEADRAAARLEAALEASGTNAMSSGDTRPLKALDNAIREEIQTLSSYGFDRAEIASRVCVASGDVDRVLES